MRKDIEDRLDPNKPALIVLFGATKRKVRPLTGDVIVLGRAPGCDIGLISPEVAPVHCVLVRLASGWRLRDCSGRTTLINGKPILDESLHHGDVVQVGTFSFEAHLPGVVSASRTVSPSPVAAIVSNHLETEAEIEKLQGSRRRFAELALNLRRRVKELASEQAHFAQRQIDLENLERRVRQVLKEQHAKQAELQQAAVSDEERKQITAREAELDAFARHLRRQSERVAQQQQELSRQVEAERAEFEADLVRQQVELKDEHQRLLQLQIQLHTRQSEVEGMANDMAAALVKEREELALEREKLAREREAMQREREELERRCELTPGPEMAHVIEVTPPAVVEETPIVQAVPEPAVDRLASARRLLRDLAERRKAAAENPLRVLGPKKSYPMH